MRQAGSAGVPARTRICLACRTLYTEDERCSGGRAHETVPLASAEGRARLRDEVWGPDSRARKARQALRAGASGAGIGSWLEGCSGCDLPSDGEALLVMLAILVVAGLAVLLYFALRALVRWIREKLDKPKPHGALAGAPKPHPRAVAIAGVVTRGVPMSLPWTSEHAFGYALQLGRSSVFGGGAMLRDAVTSGFEVRSEAGQVVRIPAGRLRVLSALPAVEAERTRVEGVLGGLGLDSRGDDALVPFDRVRAARIGPGDYVEVLGELTQDTSGDAGYRGGGVLVPTGVPVLRVRAGMGLRIEEAEALEDDHELALEEAAQTEAAGNVTR